MSKPITLGSVLNGRAPEPKSDHRLVIFLVAGAVVAVVFVVYAYMG